MPESRKPKDPLIVELEVLRQRIAKLEASEAGLKATAVMVKESEDRYQTILESLEEGYYELDRKGNFVFFNDSLCKMLGYPREELLGMNNQMYQDPETAERMNGIARQIYHSGKPVKVIDYEVTRKDGGIRVLELSASPLRDASGFQIGICGIARDITKRKQAEQMLRASEEKYRNLLESINEGYFEVDPSGNFILINDAVCKIFNDSRGALLGMNHFDYCTVEGARNIARIFDQISRTGKPATEIDVDIVRKDGAIRILSMSASLARDLSGTSQGFRGVFRDVTDRRQMERELEIKTRNLEEANIALKVLLTKREEDKIVLEQDVLSNVHQLVIPVIDKLGQTQLDSTQLACVRTLKSNLENVVSPFLRNISLGHFNLTPQEIHIANLVKEGRTTKEIAALLNLSARTIEFHRGNLRKKFDLKNKKSNLRSYLLSIS